MKYLAYIFATAALFIATSGAQIFNTPRMWIALVLLALAFTCIEAWARKQK